MKSLFFVALAAVLGLARNPIASSGQASRNVEAAEHMRLAQEYEQQNQPIPALAEYRRVLRLEPTNERAAIALSRLLYGLGLLEEAFDVRRQLLRLRPELLKVRLDLAYLLQIQGRFQEAEEEVRLVREKQEKMGVPEADPLLVYALHLTARNLLGRKLPDEGERRLLEVVRLDPNFVEAHLNLAQLYSQREETYAKAVQHFRQAVRLKPDLTIAHQQLAKTLLNQGNIEQALEHLQEALRLNPDEPESHFLLASAYRKQGDIEKTREALAKFQSMDEDKQRKQKNLLKARSLYLEGEEHLSKGDTALAQAAFVKARDLEPASHEAYVGLAKVFLDRKRPQAALDNIRRALELRPHDPMSYYIQGVCLDELGDTRGALAAVTRSTDLNPFLPQYHNFLGNLLLKGGDYPNAISAYRKAIELDPEDPVYHLNLSTALEKTGNLEESRKERALYQRLLAKK